MKAKTLNFESISELFEYLNSTSFIRAEIALPHGPVGGSCISMICTEMFLTDTGIRFKTGDNWFDLNGELVKAYGYEEPDGTWLAVILDGQPPINFICLF